MWKHEEIKDGERPKELRRIPLDVDQIKGLRAVFRRRDRVNAILADLLIETVDRVESEAEEAWDSMSRLAGIDRGSNAMSIDWLAGELVVFDNQSNVTTQQGVKHD